jgi:nucleoside-diphosphate-sugar epimerase
MDGKKEIILLTGCSGRIGTRCITRFSDQYQIVGLDLFDPGVKNPNFEWIKTDMSSDSSVEKALQTVKQKYGNKIASVIHLAAYYDFNGEPTDKYDTITVQGTRRMLEGMRSFECGQFLFSSTMLIHATCEPNEKINEAWPLLGNWDYPKSKIETEAVMHRYRGNIPIAILRIAGVYDDRCHSIPISNQIARIYEKQFASIVFPGDLTHGASFLHMDDLIDCIWLTVEQRHRLPPEFVIEVGEPVTLSYDTLQREISRLIRGKEFTTIRIPKWFAKIGAWVQNHVPFLPKTFIKPWMIDLADANYTLDITRARTVLGWNPKKSIQATLPIMIADLKKDPLSWYKEQKIPAPKNLK